MHDLFRYVPGNSVIHRLNPVTRIFLTIAICVAAFISGNLVFLAWSSLAGTWILKREAMCGSGQMPSARGRQT